MGIKLLKEKKAADYTFIDDGLNLKELAGKEESTVKKNKAEPDFRMRDDTNINKLKHKSKITGGHGMIGHSPVYE